MLKWSHIFVLAQFLSIFYFYQYCVNMNHKLLIYYTVNVTNCKLAIFFTVVQKNRLYLHKLCTKYDLF